MPPEATDGPLATWENPVKTRLRKGHPVFGITITVNSVEVAAQAAGLGFDFLWLEMEHSPITLETVRNMVLATRGLQAVPFARVPVNELWTAKRVLDAGVLGVVFPFSSTPELARQAVAACRYPPAGRRGSGARLATFRWPAPEGYHDFADKNIVVITTIEEARALEKIDEIASTPGLDVIFIGTSDLSFSLGLRGEQHHPKLDEAIARIVAAGKKHDKILGTIVGTPDEAKKFMEQGFLFFQAVAELNLMAAGAQQFLAPLGRAAVPLSTKTLY